MVERIEDFKKLINEDKKYCEQLYHYATVRLMAHKYAYYVQSGNFISDDGYDCEEKSWYVMGRALGHLKEDEKSPCIDFDEKHPLAKEGIELAKKLKMKTGRDE